MLGNSTSCVGGLSFGAGTTASTSIRMRLSTRIRQSKSLSVTGLHPKPLQMTIHPREAIRRTQFFPMGDSIDEREVADCFAKDALFRTVPSLP